MLRVAEGLGNVGCGSDGEYYGRIVNLVLLDLEYRLIDMNRFLNSSTLRKAH